MKNIILIAIVAVIAFFALKSVYKLLTGKGGCACGDGKSSCSSTGGSCACGTGHHNHQNKDEHHCDCGTKH